MNDNLVRNKKSIEISTIVNMLKAAIGVGILALPNVFYEGGYMMSSVMIIIVSMIIYNSNVMMIEVT